ncbi:MAG TPA: dephospho-CoA kinase [Candidatus Pullichristensenella avicola]|nr:dephospho-CoA kinase [Candidatus Pullichristensenella avicola]
MSANRPYIIGLTGGIGTGKSEAAKFLASLGAVHLDADAVSHALTSPGGEALEPIRAEFGDGVFREDGSLDRQALADITFADDERRRALEGILHPRIQRELMRGIDRAAEEGAKIVILDVPLLFETGMDALCDETWVLSTNIETQVARVMMRDHIDRERAEARIRSQMPNEEREKLATQVISSERPMEKTQAELAALYQQTLKRL